ncbi:MAG: Fic family protein [Patescibacteria group bacterium]
MNETIELIPRQKTILAFLAQFEKLSREQIAEKLEIIYPVSKATLARDLSELLERGQVVAVGNGPARFYRLTFQHPLLKTIDLHQYFAFDADQRQGVKTSFNNGLFVHLHDLLSKDEQSKFQNIFRSFTQATEKVDATIRQRELERFVIELSWKSSKIEGNTYTLLETERLIKENQETQGHPKQEAVMILNHKDAFQTIVKDRHAFRKINLRSIVELHNVLTKNLNIESGIRKHAVGITGTTYKPLDNEWEIKEALEKLIITVNSTAYPLEKGLIIASMMAYLQPFADGNKRTARMLANAVLLAHDYFPLSYRSVDENEYKLAQILFYETHNVYHVKRLFLEQYTFALSIYFI